MSRVRLCLSHGAFEDSPSCLPRLRLALSSNWLTLFIRFRGFCFFHLRKVFAFVLAVAFCLWFAKIAIGVQIKELADAPGLGLSPYDRDLMLCLLRLIVVLLIRVFRSRRDLLLENLALRQQLVVLKQRNPRPLVSTSDKLFWVILRRLGQEWKRALILVQPETVVRWHRAGFKLYWTWLSRRRVRAGKKCVSKELRELIFRMVEENSTWGAPRIHGELKMLGFDLSERTVLR